MFVILPMCDIPSREKTDRYLALISRIAPFAHQNEPGCLAYAWFRNAEDTDAVPSHWVRGIEVYETPEDNRETHRAGQAYKDFRAAVAAEGLLNEYPDLRFWRPTGVGFLTRDPTNMMVGRDATERTYIVVQDLSLTQSSKPEALKVLGTSAKSLEAAPEVESFWVLEREKQEDGADLTVFARLSSKDGYEAVMAMEAAQPWKAVGDLCQSAVTTTWVESGIGFLGR